ncbi:MAG: GWxTD domain-containing protein [Bacteroidales bacterium]|nr:GWxTD domain-containing protein [Bacteroidales bacterium]
MVKVFYRIILLSTGLLIFGACNLLSPVTSGPGKPLRMYNPGQAGLHPDFKIFHNKIDESTLYFRIFASELLFNQANSETRDQSRLLLEYNLYSSFSDQILDQQNEKEFVINKSEVADYYTGTVKIPTKEGKSYFLEVILTDQIRQINTHIFLLLDRFNPKSQQNFMVLTYPGNNIGFEKFYYQNEKFRVISNGSTGDSMRIAYYQPVNKLPVPPFMTDELPEPQPEPDSVWTVAYDNQQLFRLEEEGVYVFYPNTESMNGLYLSNLGDNFPQVKRAEEMLPPLQYLATAKEYGKLVKDIDIKKAVDEFWLDMGGSFATARELIRVYYNRVVFANLYFTTDRPGWMTDRGMIYMIMGPPDKVNKSETSEEWVYASTRSKQKYSFDFHLIPHPVKAYEYELKRTENHRPVWSRAIRSWREGKIFSL